VLENLVYIAEVIVNHSVNKVDKLFDYIIPPQFTDIIKEGMRVLVPFGRGNRRLEAYIFNIRLHEAGSTGRFKEIIGPIDDEPILSSYQLNMIRWMKTKYLCKYVEAIHCLIPSGLVNKEKRFITINHEELDKIRDEKNGLQKEIIDFIEKNRRVNYESLYQHFSYAEVYRVIKQLQIYNIFIF